MIKTASFESASAASQSTSPIPTPTSSKNSERKPSLQSLRAQAPLFTPTSTPLVNFSETHSEIVLFVGPAGAGKTQFFNSYFRQAGYAWCNQDILKTKANCESAVTSELRKGGKVVVDNTNTTRDGRKSWIVSHLDP